MAVEIQLTADGLWTWLAENPDAKRTRIVSREVRRGHKTAFTDWATRGRPGRRAPPASLGARFGGQAMALYGLSRRTVKYEARVRRFYGGRYLPYTSPSKQGGGGLTASGEHLRDMVTRPGGFRVAGRNNTGAVVTTTLRLGAARILNFHPKYRAEFIGFNRNDRISPKWITNRANGLATQALFKRFKRGRTKLLLRRGGR